MTEVIWQALRQYDSTVREATTVTIESGMNADGEHGYFVRIRTAGVVTYEEHWTREQRASERFERVVEEHVERGQTV